jgi:V-type H+-transporting ATPase subunit E
MEDAEAQKQIQQMVNFILNEAKDKAEEIEAKALEDFNIEKLKLVQQMKDKIRQEHVRKSKQVETQRAIARSTAINQSRLQKIAARNDMLGKVKDDVSGSLGAVTRNEAQYKKLLTDLIVQGLLLIIEEDVSVRVREVDARVAGSCLDAAAAKYSEIIKAQTGGTKRVKLTIDKSATLPPPPGTAGAVSTCLGGVTLLGMGGKVKVDNTLDARLNLACENDKPMIRQILFPLR